VQSPPNSFGHDGLMCRVPAEFVTHSQGVSGIGVACGSSDAGFKMLGRTWGGCIFACWARKIWRVTCKSAKLLSRRRIRASPSEMGVVSESMGFGWYQSGGKFAGGPKSHRRLEAISKKLRPLTSWPGDLTTFSPPKGEYSSVRATLRSGPEGLILARENQSY
jgi:hypothetical protein